MISDKSNSDLFIMEELNLLGRVTKLKELSTPYGKLILGEQLGQGGTSIVRVASFADSEVRVAVKFLLTDISKNEPREYKRFKQASVNVLRALHTGCLMPNMGILHVDILGATVPYQIMPVAETTLKKAYKNSDISYEEFCDVFKRIVYMVANVHSKGIIHRDIKPENIFKYDGQWVLGDFDIAKFDDKNVKLLKTETGERLANYYFSAPEQSDPNIGEVCEASDWFAVAQILYWLKRKSTIKTLSVVKLDDGDTRYQRFDKLLTKMLLQDPKHRIASLDQIETFLKAQNHTDNMWKERNRDITALRIFDEVVYKYTSDVSSGSDGIEHVDNTEEINDILVFLGEHIDSLRLRAVYNAYDFEVGSVYHTDAGTWMLGDDEIAVKSIFVYRSKFSSGGHMIIIQGGNLKSKDNGFEGSDYEEICLFKDQAIKRSEYDSGWAKINGKRIKLKGEAKVVSRHLKPHLYFISPEVSPVTANFEFISGVERGIGPVSSVTTEMLERVLFPKIRRAQNIRLWD